MKPPSFLAREMINDFSSTCISVDLQEAQIAGSDKGNDLVVPLLMQNKPPVVKGKEKDELADVDLRPEQVLVTIVLRIYCRTVGLANSFPCSTCSIKSVLMRVLNSMVLPIAYRICRNHLIHS